MKNNTLALILIAILAVLAIIVVRITANSIDDNIPTLYDEPSTEEFNETTEQRSEATFTWTFEDSEEQTLDGYNKQDVYVTAEFDNTETQRVFIETVDGGCSEIESDSYEGDVSNTGRVQCYYAGFGQQYRITGDSEQYYIERKYFEEGLPDVEPIEYQWEVLAEI